MHHPELEKQLEELKAKRKAATQDLRNLATEAIESTDKVNKTMMMFWHAAGTLDGCECSGVFCLCHPPKKSISRIFKKDKLRKRLSDSNGTHP